VQRAFSLRAPLVTVVVASGWCLALACGARTGLPPGTLEAGGSAGMAGTINEPACVTAADCPQPPPDQCGTASCNEGVCALVTAPACDDGDPCTVDMCVSGGCMFTDGRVDADGDGVFARGTSADPRAALGCGNDCDDSAANVYPGAPELCDSLDNDCNGIIDDGTSLLAPHMPPTRVSPQSAMHAQASGLAFDGTAFGATITNWMGRSQGQFQLLDAQGKLLGDPQRIARVNAEAYGGPLVWASELGEYLTAYEDARQGGSYEIYFDLLNSKGLRVIEDLRVTNADDYSLRPNVLWTGAEALLVFDDRRLAGAGDKSVLFGQRVSGLGKLIGENVRISPMGVHAENASAALSKNGVGIAFVLLDAAQNNRVAFMTTSRTLQKPSAVTNIEFDGADDPQVTVLDDTYIVTFHQDTGVIGPAIFGVVIDKNGKITRGPLSMTTGAPHARSHATYSYGDRFVMVWADDRDGVYQLYAQSFNKSLAPVSQRLRVTSTGSVTVGPVIAPANDGGLGVLYTDQGTGATQAFFTRLDCQDAQLK
jgi:hypothetical protein